LVERFYSFNNISATMTAFNSLTERLRANQNKSHNLNEEIVDARGAEYHPIRQQKQASRLEKEKSSEAPYDFGFDILAEAKKKDILIGGMPEEEDIISPVGPALQNLDSYNRSSTDFNYSPDTLELAQPTDHSRTSSRFSHRLSSILTKGASSSNSNSSNSSSSATRAPKHIDLTDLLCSAASAGNTQFLGRILGAGGDLAKRNTSGLPPLHVAAQAGQGEAVRCLARMGASLTAKDAQGFTALQRAVLAHQRHIVPHLANLGADVNGKSAGGCSALHLAAAMASVDVVGAAAAAAAAAGGAVGLRRASTPSSSRSSRSANLRFSYTFNGQKSDWRKSHESDLSSYDDCSILEALIRAGADMECRDGNGETALHAAVRSRNVQNVTILLDQGACINVRNTAGLTPLAVLAAQSERNEAISALLLARGAVVTPMEEKKQRFWFGRAVL
jgi:ankyrin repeat protein